MREWPIHPIHPIPGECFVPAMAAAILAYLSLAAILPSDGYALVALAAVWRTQIAIAVATYADVPLVPLQFDHSGSFWIILDHSGSFWINLYIYINK